MSDIKTIDCFGDVCPLPMLKIEKQLLTMETGDEFMIVTDHSCTLSAIKEKYGRVNASISYEEVMNGVWEVYIKKL